MTTKQKPKKQQRKLRLRFEYPPAIPAKYAGLDADVARVLTIADELRYARQARAEYAAMA
jgi:hypothetical protein